MFSPLLASSVQELKEPWHYSDSKTGNKYILSGTETVRFRFAA